MNCYYVILYVFVNKHILLALIALIRTNMYTNGTTMGEKGQK